MRMFWHRRFWLDLRMGRCSGLPSCCITFFSTGWRVLFGRANQSLSEKSRWRRNAILWYHRKSGQRGYIPCPLCIISGARVRVLKCTTSCGHREESRRLILDQDPTAKFISDI